MFQDVVQLGRMRRSGRRDQGFKSLHPDHFLFLGVTYDNDGYEYGNVYDAKERFQSVKKSYVSCRFL